METGLRGASDVLEGDVAHRLLDQTRAGRAGGDGDLDGGGVFRDAVAASTLVARIEDGAGRLGGDDERRRFSRRASGAAPASDAETMAAARRQVRRRRAEAGGFIARRAVTEDLIRRARCASGARSPGRSTVVIVRPSGGALRFRGAPGWADAAAPARTTSVNTQTRHRLSTRRRTMVFTQKGRRGPAASQGVFMSSAAVASGWNCMG